MKHSLKLGCLGLIIGIFAGIILGVIIHFINWYGLEIGLSSLTRTEYNFFMLAIFFGIGGAILIGFLGLICGFIYASFKKPEEK